LKKGMPSDLKKEGYGHSRGGGGPKKGRGDHFFRRKLLGGGFPKENSIEKKRTENIHGDKSKEKRKGTGRPNDESGKKSQ